MIMTKHKAGYADQYELRLYISTMRWLLPQLTFCVEEKEIRRVAFIEYLSKRSNRWNQWNRNEIVEAQTKLLCTIHLKKKRKNQ